MRKETNHKSLENFKDAKITKKQAKEVNGAWLFQRRNPSVSPVRGVINYVCYGNVNGIENRRW